MRAIFLIAAGALAAAPLDWPYAYYQLLRLGVTALACWLSFEAHKASLAGWRNVGAVIAVVFNPILPIAFDRELWAWIDWAVASVFVVGAIVLPRKPGEAEKTA